MNVYVKEGTNAGIRRPFVEGHAPTCECSKCIKGVIVEKDSGLSMTYSADDETAKLDGVEVSPEGHVTVGVPLITSFAVPPDNDEEKENV